MLASLSGMKGTVAPSALPLMNWLSSVQLKFSRVQNGWLDPYPDEPADGLIAIAAVGCSEKAVPEFWQHGRPRRGALPRARTPSSPPFLRLPELAPSLRGVIGRSRRYSATTPTYSAWAFRVGRLAG